MQNTDSKITSILTFWLDNPISVDKNVESLPEIELLFDKEREGYLTGCRATIYDSTEEKVNLAIARVEFLAHYLGLITGLTLSFSGPSITKYQNGKYLGTIPSSIIMLTLLQSDISSYQDGSALS
jgi:hypothetical protein